MKNVRQSRFAATRTRLERGMSFDPPSSIAPVSVTVAGTVAVSNFPATQPVSGTVAVSNFPATQPVSGTVSVGNFPATQPVSGTVTADQGAGGPGWAVLQATDPWHVDASSYTVPVSVTGQPILVDGSAVTQPVSAASLPLPAGAATDDTLSRVNGAVQDVALTAILEREKIPA